MHFNKRKPPCPSFSEGEGGFFYPCYFIEKEQRVY